MSNLKIIKEGIYKLNMGASESSIVNFVYQQELVIQSEEQDAKRRAFIIDSIFRNFKN
tara:strand:- start:576 stop:749 length:174 start_codon:yes stop_codon:yes gene_type:complete